MTPESIRRIRVEALRMNRAEFGRAMGVSAGRVTRWENGEGNPSQTAINLMNALTALHLVDEKLGGVVRLLDAARREIEERKAGSDV